MIAVFDIDGTLSIPGERLKYIKQPKKDWDAFYNGCYQDEPNEPIVDICKALYEGAHYISFVTGRPEKVRSLTIEWLVKHGLGFQGSRLYMRKTGDYRPDTIVKPELVKNILPDISMVFEDRQCMVDAWRKLGLTCLQVTEGDY